MSKYPLVQYENGEYYSGHYRKSIELKITIEESLKKDQFDTCLMLLPEDGSYPCPYDNAVDLLHGSCNLFATVLNQLYDYDVFEIIDVDGKTVHWYASKHYKGVNIYIDVRGATSDFDKFISPFIHTIKMSYTEIQRQNEELVFSEDWSDTGVLFAHWLIDKNQEFYKVEEKK